MKSTGTKPTPARPGRCGALRTSSVSVDMGDVSRRRCGRCRRGAALLLSLFVMTVASATVIYILDTETVQFAALRNTLAYDRARYLSEAGLQHALAELELDFSWRNGVPVTAFPPGSDSSYSATVYDGADGAVIVTAVGTTPIGDGRFVTRSLQISVKQGG